VSAFWDIPELEQLHSGPDLIRVPNEQNVPFTPRVRDIIDTSEFQRLAQVRQLGFVSLVYPGACHTRFEHALGVYHNALRYLRQLWNDPRFRSQVSRRDAERLIVASLLHDLGHWPYCHPIEDLRLDGMPPHEVFAGHFLQPGTQLRQVLQDAWGFAPDEFLELLVSPKDGAVSPSNTLKLLRSILSGPIDIDKMDYLERDSLHAGVPYGRNFDKNRLIQSLLLNEAGDGLAISSKGKTAAELMVFARYVMFSEVYWHHAVRSATAMFARAFFELRHTFDLRAMFQMSEADTVALLRRTAKNTPSQELVEGIFGSRRQLYKRLTEAGLSQNRELYDLLARQPFARLVESSSRLAETFGRLLGESVQPTEILIDGPPAHREVEFRIDLYFAKEQRYRPLHEVSPVVAALAQTQFDDYVKRVRIYAHPRFARRLQALPNLPGKIAEAIGT
jgi:HD superfamily phosphohydrolase